MVTLTFVGMSVILILLMFFKVKEVFDDLVFAALLSVIAGIILIMATCLVAKFTDGLNKNYSHGEKVGYLTSISETGVIWKTYEGELHQGSGTQTAVKEPWDFSIEKGNTELYNKVKELQGKKVKLMFKEWMLQPYKLGRSNVQLTSAELIE